MTVGVTGGIGAGKSSVCRVFEAGGALVVEADAVGHETAAHPAVLPELMAAFGADITDGEGRLVRRELGQRAFVSEASRQKLNTIVWPALNRRLQALVRKALEERPDRAVVIDAALLVEWGGLTCDALVVVTAPPEARVARTVSRLGISRAQAQARMASQLPDEEKVRVADYVIVNDGSLKELEAKARAVWTQIVK